ncbi:unnamed protein product [Brassica oleracea]
MKDCPIPEGYDAGRVRVSLEAAFKERGYSGPVSISAYGDQTQTPGHILQGLVPTGISNPPNNHALMYHVSCIMYQDIVEWRGQNAPPATMMIISDKVRGDIDWDLLRQQQRTRYNLFLAYSVKPQVAILLCTSEEWCWTSLLYSKQSAPVVV